MCFDTNLLIWGVQKVANAGQEYLIDRTARFIEHLDHQGAVIVVPSVVLGEYLLGTPKEEHAAVLRVFTRRFEIAPYDAPSAGLAAILWQDLKSGELAQSEWLKGKARAELKADVQWVATAIVHGANVIYSNDGDVEKIANGRIKVLEVPDIPTQARLFV